MRSLFKLKCEGRKFSLTSTFASLKREDPLTLSEDLPLHHRGSAIFGGLKTEPGKFANGGDFAMEGVIGFVKLRPQ